MKSLTPRVRTGLALLLGTLAAAVPLRTASARDPSPAEIQLAKDMIKEAIGDEKENKCADAIDVLKQAIAITDTAEAELHMGVCLAKLGKLKDGLGALAKADELAKSSKDPRDKAIQKDVAAKLTEVGGRIPKIAIKLPANVKDPSVTLDGAVANAEGPIDVEPGEHTVEATAPGRTPFSKKITVAEKETQTVTVELPSVGGGDTEPPPPPPPAPSSGGIPLVSIIAGSAGVVLGIGGVIAFVAAGSAASDGKDQCAKQVKCDDGTIKSVHTLDTAALALWIGAGVGIGGAVGYYFVNKPKAQRPAEAARGSKRPAGREKPSAEVVLGLGGVGVRGVF